MEFGQTLHQLPLAVFLRRDPLAYPIVESVHLIAMALLFGALMVVDLRILGLSGRLPLQPLARHALPMTVVAFVVVALSGALLFVAHAADLVGNSAFLLKLGLIALAGVNAAWFHIGPYAQVANWKVGGPAPAGAWLMAAASILIWTSVIVCGRFIAYS